MLNRRRLVATASVIALAGTLGFAITDAPANAATVTFNVANDHATCNTLSGTVTFATALKNSGPTTGTNTITIKAAVAGCTDTDKSTVKMFKGTIAATLTTNNGSNCTGLLGPSAITASAQIVWTPGSGQKFTPTVAVGTVQKPVSNLSFTQVNGGTFAMPASEAPDTASYGKFQLGAAYGVAPISGTVDFTGGDGGATGWFEGLTQQDALAIFAACGTAAGEKTISFGIGAVHAG
jgi:hypothetical protein